MSKKGLSLRLMCLCCTTFLVLLFIGQTNLYSSTTDTGDRLQKGSFIQEGSLDTIIIDLLAIQGGNQMPGVKFFHDLHTEKVKKNDCSVCHLKEEGQFVFKFKRLKDTNTETDMAIYHDNCIACHAESKGLEKKSGPLEAQCRNCHNANSDAETKSNIKTESTSNIKIEQKWNPIDFDKSLHNRHEKAKNIVSTTKSRDAAAPVKSQDVAVSVTTEKEPNCSACHHSYDEKSQKIFYEKGKEGSCLYCHKDVKVNKADSMRNVFHNGCINCHLVEMKNFAGPINCKGCHDIEEQKKIEKLQNIPRLKRGQPDITMITAWNNLLTSSKNNSEKPISPEELPEKIAKTYKQSMNPVIFNHQNHENSSKNCRTCHHSSLENCKECHTVSGSDKGGFVKLEKAMHEVKSHKSCIGCHSEYKNISDCAGCHGQMAKKSFAQFADNDDNCAKCHSVDAEALNLAAMDKASMSDTATKIVHERNATFKKVSDDKIPEKISIGYIVDKYEASEFPHKKIINSIKKRIEKNSMAQAFHGDETTLCMGCHHNSPATENPQKCGSCHGKSEIKDNGSDGRPSLKGAYHGQCITCHQNMKIETVAATDCNKCHKEKKQ